MTAPQRIQRRRTKGWQMPEGAVYVGRPTRWGNPYVMGREGNAVRWTHWLVVDSNAEWHPRVAAFETEREARADAVARYRLWAQENLDGQRLVDDLAGRDLACWCPLDQPCHADVLLEVANR